MSDTPRRGPSFAAACAALALCVVAVFAWVGPRATSAGRAVRGEERSLAQYVARVGVRGAGELRVLNDEWRANRFAAPAPSPSSRTGYVLATAMLSKLIGSSPQDLARYSVASLAALVVAVFAFARRRLGDAAGAAAAALTAASPLYLSAAHCGLDDLASCFLQLAALGLFFEALCAPRRARMQLVFALVFTIALIESQSALLLALPMLAFAFVERVHDASRPSPARVATLIALPIVLASGAWMLAAGGWSAMLASATIATRAPNLAVPPANLGGGPWYRYLADGLLLSPWTTALGFAAIVIVLWRRLQGEYERTHAFLALVCILVIAQLAFFEKNLRSIAVLEAPLRILVVAVAWQLFELARTRARIAFACVALLALVAFDVRNFELVFARRPSEDPTTLALLQARGMVPTQPPR